MEKEKETALINGEMIAYDYLFKRACNLMDISQELKVVADLLEQLEFLNSKKDTFGVEYFFQQKKLYNAVNVLENLVKQVDGISTDICPD